MDVFDRDGRPVGRRSLDLPARRCLVCREAAVDCIRAARHDSAELAASVARLLHADECAHFAEALTAGARIELELTPKPGLVDRRDNGSHPDLSFELMSRSIELLPQDYDELLRCGTDLQACVQAGKRAERRMLEAIGTNAHRGYIFLSGLVLLAFAEDGRDGDHANDRRDACPTEPNDRRDACPTEPNDRRDACPTEPNDRRDACPTEPNDRRDACPTEPDRRDACPTEPNDRRDACPTEWLRRSIARETRRLLALRPAPGGTHGAQLRQRHGAGGIHAEALAGLPSVFEHGLAALDAARGRFGATDTAHHWLMAALMTRVEDTTALHRCGAAGLARLRADGQQIRQAIEEGRDYLALLAELNDVYRAMGLTMGGVADCMAITIAVQEIERLEPQPHRDRQKAR